MTDTFDMVAELQRRESDGSLVFPAGPVIAEELERLQKLVDLWVPKATTESGGTSTPPQE